MELKNFNHPHPLKLVEDQNGESEGESHFKGMNHEHPLHRFDEYSKSKDPSWKELRGDEMCNACMQRISAPYYGCSDSDCTFRLHKYCAELPGEIVHPLHPQHALTLVTSCCVTCDACGDLCNTFAYFCNECRYGFNLDVKCAFFPVTIKHQAHQHNLTIEKEANNNRARCKACQQLITARALQCTSCNFNIHLKCASLPRAVEHIKNDKHANLVLTYSPPGGPTEEYRCELCEEEINPKQWFYYSGDGDCNISSHTGCLFSGINDEINFKYPPITNDDLHPHPLTFVRRSKDHPPPCDRCGNPCFGIAFQCNECDYNLDFECGSKFVNTF